MYMYICIQWRMWGGDHWAMAPHLDSKNLFLTLFLFYNWVVAPPPTFGS